MHDIANKNRYYKYALFVLIAFIMAASTLIVTVDGAEYESNASSMVDVEFTEGSGEVDPLDPVNPEVPPNGGGEEGTGNAGPLALNYVSNISFGTEPISANYEVYSSITPTPFIQVTDATGEAAGWIVKAEVSKFYNDGVHSLQGSTIKLRNGYCPTDHQPTIPPPIPKQDITLPTDGSTNTEIVEALPATGMGTWLTNWFTTGEAPNDSVLLTVESFTGLKGSNVATITWKLEVTPA